MSDTPETDASTISRHDYWGDDLDPNGDIVPADFARRLERERDAARRVTNASITLDHSEVIFTFSSDEAAREFYGRFERKGN